MSDGARHERCDAEPDEHRSRDPPLEPEEPTAVTEDGTRRAGSEGPHEVARERDEHEDRPEHRQLRPGGGVRIDELRQEREEEQGRLRVQHVDDDSLRVDTTEGRLGAPSPDRALHGAHQDANPQVHQVHRPRDLHGRERGRRGGQDGGEPDDRREDVHETPACDPEGRHHSDPPPTVHRLRHDVEHGGAWHHGERERSEGEHPERAGVERRDQLRRHRG